MKSVSDSKKGEKGRPENFQISIVEPKNLVSFDPATLCHILKFLSTQDIFANASRACVSLSRAAKSNHMRAHHLSELETKPDYVVNMFVNELPNSREEGHQDLIKGLPAGQLELLHRSATMYYKHESESKEISKSCGILTRNKNKFLLVASVVSLGSAILNLILGVWNGDKGEIEIGAGLAGAYSIGFGIWHCRNRRSFQRLDDLEAAQQGLLEEYKSGSSLK